MMIPINNLEPDNGDDIAYEGDDLYEDVEEDESCFDYCGEIEFPQPSPAQVRISKYLEEYMGIIRFPNSIPVSADGEDIVLSFSSGSYPWSSSVRYVVFSPSGEFLYESPRFATEINPVGKTAPQLWLEEHGL